MAQPIERIVFQRQVEVGGRHDTVFHKDTYKLRLDFSGPGRVFIDDKEFPYALVQCIDRVAPPEGVEPEEPGVHGCDICFTEFNSAQALGAHKRQKHGIAGSSRGRGEEVGE